MLTQSTTNSIHSEYLSSKNSIAIMYQIVPNKQSKKKMYEISIFHGVDSHGRWKKTVFVVKTSS